MQELISLSQSSAVEKYRPVCLCRKKEEFKFCCYETNNGTESIVEWNLKHHRLLLLLLRVVCILLSLQKCLETPLENFTWDLKHLNHSPYGILNFNYDFSTDSNDRKENWVFCGIKLCFFLPFLYADAKTLSSKFFACVNSALITLNITASINTGFA